MKRKLFGCEDMDLRTTKARFVIKAIQRTGVCPLCNNRIFSKAHMKSLTDKRV